jgi:hypothetical protein
LKDLYHYATGTQLRNAHDAQGDATALLTILQKIDCLWNTRRNTTVIKSFAHYITNSRAKKADTGQLLQPTKPFLNASAPAPQVDESDSDDDNSDVDDSGTNNPDDDEIVVEGIQRLHLGDDRTERDSERKDEQISETKQNTDSSPPSTSTEAIWKVGVHTADPQVAQKFVRQSGPTQPEKCRTPLGAFMCFFGKIEQLLVDQTVTQICMQHNGVL